MAKIAIANWKMNLLAADGVALVQDLTTRLKGRDVEVVICPPFTILSAIGQAMRDSGFSLGAQDCHGEDKGAYTGDISAKMLADLRCYFVLAGHSERRMYHHESSEMVAKKAAAAIRAGLVPIICVGEDLKVRDENGHLALIESQLKASITPDLDMAEIIIAYEPIWAIGTGRTANLTEITEMHQHIKTVLQQNFPANSFRVVYGGSVTDANAEEILSLDAVDGVLVGGASLKAESFAKIALGG